jgi:hypothetical protein
MPDPDPQTRQLERLRQWRVRKDRDHSMGFLSQQFKKEIAKPYKQLQSITELWQKLVPENMLPFTRLESLVRGILKVTVNSSAMSYELDRLLRTGLQKQLITQHKGPAFRRVQIRVGVIDAKPDAYRKKKQRSNRDD